MYYLIKETLTPCEESDILGGSAQYVVVLTSRDWQRQREHFDMLIDMDMDASQETKAVVNKDSLTGTLSIPDRFNISGPRHNFSFALDEKGIVLVDDSGYVAQMMRQLSATKRWRLPSLERFLRSAGNDHRRRPGIFGKVGAKPEPDRGVHTPQRGKDLPKGDEWHTRRPA